MTINSKALAGAKKIRAIITRKTVYAGNYVFPGDVVELNSPYLINAKKAEKHDEKTAKKRIAELKSEAKKKGRPAKTETPKTEGAE